MFTFQLFFAYQNKNFVNDLKDQNLNLINLLNKKIIEYYLNLKRYHIHREQKNTSIKYLLDERLKFLHQICNIIVLLKEIAKKK